MMRHRSQSSSYVSTAQEVAPTIEQRSDLNDAPS